MMLPLHPATERSGLLFEEIKSRGLEKKLEECLDILLAGRNRAEGLKLFSNKICRSRKHSYLCSPKQKGKQKKEAKGAMPGVITQKIYRSSL